MGNIYITGDTHGQFSRIKDFCLDHELTKQDTIIILGDAGINYHGGLKDLGVKKYIDKHIPATLFCIHGNHEMRPQNINSYKVIDFWGGKAYNDPQFSNIIFAIDGEIYDINGAKTMVCGGAYSVDKNYRIANDLKWFSDEQPSEAIKQKVEKVLAEHNNKVDVFLSHTCPYNYRPVEKFLSSIDQSTVDSSTELWLQEIEDKIQYKYWFCGHYHTNKNINDKLMFLFDDVLSFPCGE